MQKTGKKLLSVLLALAMVLSLLPGAALRAAADDVTYVQITSTPTAETLANSSEATSTLGKTVELNIGDTTAKGMVEGVTRGENPQILVNGMYYTMDKIAAVYAE